MVPPIVLPAATNAAKALIWLIESGFAYRKLSEVERRQLDQVHDSANELLNLEDAILHMVQPGDSSTKDKDDVLNVSLKRTQNAFEDASQVTKKWERKCNLKATFTESNEVVGDKSIAAGIVTWTVRAYQWTPRAARSFFWKGLCVIYASKDMREVLDRLYRCMSDLRQQITMYPLLHSNCEPLQSAIPYIQTAWRRMCGDEDNPKALPLPPISTAELHNYMDNSSSVKYSYGIRIGMAYTVARRVIVRAEWKDRGLPAAEVGHRLERIARMLNAFPRTSRHLGLMNCSGVVHDNNSHKLIFELPAFAHACKPGRTLREVLISGSMPDRLDRLRFARTLATSVAVIHALGIVHKFINPESILVIEDDATATASTSKRLEDRRLGEPYLLGFEHSRPEQGISGNLSYHNNKLRSNVYVHPDHFGQRRRKFEMMDDMFSLGVCLLEIALWKSLFRRYKPAKVGVIESESRATGSGSGVSHNHSIGNRTQVLCDDDLVPYTSFIDLRDATIRDQLQTECNSSYDYDESILAKRRQTMLIDLAERKVPSFMGEKYKNAVVACLRSSSESALGLLDVKQEVRGTGRLAEGSESRSLHDSTASGNTDETSPSHQALSPVSGVKNVGLDELLEKRISADGKRCMSLVREVLMNLETL